MKNVNWAQVVVFGLVALVVFVLGASVLFLLFGGGWGMMGPTLMDPRGTGWCPWCGGTGRMGGGLLGGVLGLVLGCLFPLIVLGLLIVGGIWLARNTGRGRPSSEFQPPEDLKNE